MPEEKKEVISQAEIVEVPTQYAPAIKVGEEVLDDRQFLVKIYNLLLELNRKI